MNVNGHLQWPVSVSDQGILPTESVFLTPLRQPYICRKKTGAPAGFKNVDAQPVGSGASLREMIRNIDNYFAIG